MMIYLARLLRSAAFWIGLAVALAAGTAYAQPRVLTGQERARCIAEGGRIGIAGLIGGEMCVRRLRDAGRPCRDRSDCEGACLYDSGGRTVAPGTRVAGRCQAEAYPFGCHSFVANGRLQPTICID